MTGRATGANSAAATQAQAVPSAELLPATISGTRYRVSKLLGEGGSKMVYLAHDSMLDRDVAIALFRIEGLDEAGRQRVIREARAMGRLGDNPNIVNVYDIGEEDGQPFIVSQFMPGGSLDDRLKRSPGRKLAVADALRIGEQVCAALEYSHSLGIIHRDVKPANVFLTSDGQARLGDFGLAIAPDQSRLTMKGMMVGTAAYMPPEQALGHQLEPRSDLYSFGAMLYELLTARPPFTGDDLISIVSQHVTAAPEPPGTKVTDLPEALDQLVLRLLAKEPTQRPTAAQARESLRTIASAEKGSMDQLASSVMVERPNLAAHAAPDGTVSILFSDIENSTVMTEKLGDFRAQEVLHLHNRIIRDQVALQRGYEVKSMGDGFMIAFNSARRALMCAVGIQKAFAKYCAEHPDEPIRVRIGLNTGEVIHEAGDFFGRAVILAARVGAVAQGGEILVSQTFKDVTGSESGVRYGEGRDANLKGLSGTYRLYRVEWADAGPTSAAVPPPDGSMAAYPSAQPLTSKRLRSPSRRLRRRLILAAIVLLFAGPALLAKWRREIRALLSAPEKGRPIAQASVAGLAKPAAPIANASAAAQPKSEPTPTLALRQVTFSVSTPDGNSIGPARAKFSLDEFKKPPYLKWSATFDNSLAGVSYRDERVMVRMFDANGKVVAVGGADRVVWKNEQTPTLGGVIAMPGNAAGTANVGTYRLQVEQYGHVLGEGGFSIATARPPAEHPIALGRPPIVKPPLERAPVARDGLVAANAEFDPILMQIHAGARADQVPPPSPATVAAIRSAAEQGDSGEEFRMGKMTQLGLGVPQNISQSAEWYEKSAAGGNVKAAGALGAMYFFGKGKPKDFVWAMKESMIAAQHGDDSAAFRVGIMHLRGWGVPRDPKSGLTWLEKAAADDYPQAEFVLGMMYFQGNNVPRDYRQAMEWYKKAAAHGRPEAARRIGFMYQRGLGVQQDRAEAGRWFREAAADRERPPPGPGDRIADLPD